jgi:hypothetical protein
MVVFEREQLKDKNILFSDTKEMPLRIEVSDREIKVIGSSREVVLPKDSLRAKAILDRLKDRAGERVFAGDILIIFAWRSSEALGVFTISLERSLRGSTR